MGSGPMDFRLVIRSLAGTAALLWREDENWALAPVQDPALPEVRDYFPATNNSDLVDSKGAFSPKPTPSAGQILPALIR